MESGSRRPLLSAPRGFRDILPTEARELRVIEQALTETFAASGYMPLKPPMIEYSAAQPTQERLIQFLDTDRSLVALRPDLTTAVARLVAQRYRETAGALRLSYFAPVFREEPAMTAGDREVVQAGVELIGAAGPLAGDDVRELRQVVHLARERWPGSVKLWGSPNIGLVPALPYYTAIVFEALHPDVGVIASGGRYDLLIGAYGAPRPATGFAIDVLRLHRALFAEGWRPADARPLVTLHGDDERATMRCAASLRAAGLSVAI